MNTVVHIAIDHESKSEDKVALKFSCNSFDYRRELSSRQHFTFDSNHVLPVITHYDCEESIVYAMEFQKHGFDSFLNCLVLPAGNRNLAETLVNELRLKSEDKLDFIRSTAASLMKSLAHIHESGLIHGDVKPQNVVKIGDNWVFIDLDSSAVIGSGFAGCKLHSAYAPPEMVTLGNNGTTAILKSYSYDQKTGTLLCPMGIHESELVPAAVSHDCWALGVLLFQMASGEPLFLSNATDDIDVHQLVMLAKQVDDDDWMDRKLLKIENDSIRNMISQLLIVDPLTRPSMTQILFHPFISGGTPGRLLGQKAEYDVFLSYRVASDSNIASALYELLTLNGLRVWWDQKCLQPGDDWEQGLFNGLVSSQIFVAILSKEAINSSTKSTQNFASLSSSSQCDNVLLEHRIALEMLRRGLVTKIFPVMVGEPLEDDPSMLSKYDFVNLQCMETVVVDSIETKLKLCCKRQCLGTPLTNRLSVKDTLDALTRNQGCFLIGEKQQSLLQAVLNIRAMHTSLTNACRNRDSKDSDMSGKCNATAVLPVAVTDRHSLRSPYNISIDFDNAEDVESGLQVSTPASRKKTGRGLARKGLRAWTSLLSMSSNTDIS